MDKFSSELKRCLRKYPRTRVYDLLQLLFHGTKNTKPIEIYASEFGLDNRFAYDGYYGKGSYFANSAHYSFDYHHRTDETITDEFGKHSLRTVYQQFLCFVIKGESVSLPRQSL